MNSTWQFTFEMHKFAEYYEMKGLSTVCADHLATLINKDNVSAIARYLFMVPTTQRQSITNALEDFIARNPGQILTLIANHPTSSSSSSSASSSSSSSSSSSASASASACTALVVWKDSAKDDTVQSLAAELVRKAAAPGKDSKDSKDSLTPVAKTAAAAPGDAPHQPVPLTEKAVAPVKPPGGTVPNS